MYNRQKQILYENHQYAFWIGQCIQALGTQGATLLLITLLDCIPIFWNPIERVLQ